MSKSTTRRGFIQKFAASVAGAAVAPAIVNAGDANAKIEFLKRAGKVGANDTINIALIGAGGMGLADTNTAITVPGVKLVAACDLYDGRLADAKNEFMGMIFSLHVITRKSSAEKMYML
ncbi:MAG: hypothetical protein NVV59_16715 [Chitinophagaceae bacterium]|nr:hypothetical protein [Chitinophagaceae bacterium]